MPARMPAEEQPVPSNPPGPTPEEVASQNPTANPETARATPVRTPRTAPRRSGGRVTTGNVSYPVTRTPAQIRNGITALTADESAALRVLDEVEQNCTLQVISTLSSQAERSIMLAKAIIKAESALEPFRPTIESLKNTPLGFLLDKPEQYDWPILRRICAEAMLRGSRITGNEFNGIAKKCYLTQAYFVRRCREWPGVNISQEIFGIPRTLNGQTVVDYKIVYNRDGVEEFYSREGNQAIAVRVNDGMGADAIIGKAKRKAYAGLLEQLIMRSGETWSPGTDGEINDATETPRGTDTTTASATTSNPANDLMTVIAQFRDRISACTPAELPVVGRNMCDATQVQNGLWTSVIKSAFYNVFAMWFRRRLETISDITSLNAAIMTRDACMRHQNCPDATTIRAMEEMVSEARSRIENNRRA